jgi:hypothetical protein
MLEIIKPNLYKIATNSYGTRGLQKILDYANTPKDIEILNEFLKNNIFKLVQDMNGNHVIQKVLVVFPNQNCRFIYEELAANILEISKLKQGTCIIQKALERDIKLEKVKNN